MKIDIPSHLSDDDLVARVKSLVRCEREATASLIAHLAELDARRLYLGAGFSSLFTYCCEVLHLSEPAAYNRIEAARAGRRFPTIVRLLGDGALSLATVRLLASHLTAENHKELLAVAAGKSKRQVGELLVLYFPKPDVPPSVRKLPAPSAPWAATLPVSSNPPASASGASQLLPESRSVLPVAARRPVVSPLAPDRYEIRFTANAETREKVRLAQDLLRHVIPTGDVAEVIDRALTALLEDLARKKFAATKRPRASHGTAPGSRDIAAKVRRREHPASLPCAQRVRRRAVLRTRASHGASNSSRGESGAAGRPRPGVTAAMRRRRARRSEPAAEMGGVAIAPSPRAAP